MFDTHEIILAENAPTESFHAADFGLSALDSGARERMFAAFPHLRADPRSYGPTARRCLKAHEAPLLREMFIGVDAQPELAKLAA